MTVWLVTRFESGAVAEPQAAVNPYTTWLVAASSVVQVITPPVLPMASVDTPLITGAVLSTGSGFSIGGGVAAGSLSGEHEPAVKTAPPIKAARHTSPMQTISHLFNFLMTTSVYRKLET